MRHQRPVPDGGSTAAVRDRRRAVVVLAVVALLATLAPPAAAQDDSPWSSYQADAGNTRQAVADGPSDPGVKWLRDLAEPQAGDQVANEDGWGLKAGRRGQGMPVVGPDGELLLRASSEDEDTDDVLLALDPDSGAVLWEHETDSFGIRDTCEPVVDSQGRVWILDATGDETALVGLDAASGDVLVSLEDGEDGDVPACTRSALLVGGQGDDERLVIPGRSGEPEDVVGVDVSADDGDVAVAWALDDDGGDLTEVLGAGDNWDRSDSFALSDDALFLGVRTGEDDAETVELVAVDLDDGSVTARTGLPTPPVEDDEDAGDHDVNDYRRLRMLVADDTLVLGPEDAEFDHLVAYDVSDGLAADQSHLWLERDETMGRWAMSSQGDTVVTLAGPRPSRDLVGRSLADGSEQWRKDSTTGTQENIIPVGADGGLFVRQSGGDIAGLAPDGMREWFFTPDGLAAALGVDELEEVGYSSANTVIGPIDGEGTLYFASRSANRDALLAIDSSGGLADVEPEDDEDRLAGADRIGTAIDLAQEFDEADTVLIARGDDFPDALAGAPLASHLDAPILLSNPGSMTESTLAEVERLGASEARLLGGEAALSSTVEGQLEAAGLDVERYEGADRWETAALIAEDLPEDDAAFVARGRVIGDPDSGWEDAVAVSALAAFTETPILLTDTDTLPADTAAALAGRSEVTIAGGDAVVSPGVENAIDGGDGGRTDRLAGANRWETSSEIADASVDEGMDPETTYLATGLNFPDALAAAPVVGATAPEVAEASGGVLLLVDGDDLSRSRASSDWLSDNAGDIERIRPVGGRLVVADNVVDEARGLVGIE